MFIMFPKIVWYPSESPPRQRCPSVVRWWKKEWNPCSKRREESPPPKYFRKKYWKKYSEKNIGKNIGKNIPKKILEKIFRKKILEKYSIMNQISIFGRYISSGNFNSSMEKITWMTSNRFSSHSVFGRADYCLVCSFLPRASTRYSFLHLSGVGCALWANSGEGLAQWAFPANWAT